MHILSLFAASLALAVPAAAQQPTAAPPAAKPAPAVTAPRDAASGQASGKRQPAPGDADQAVAGGGVLPEGWSWRTDREAPVANVKFAAMGGGYHVTVGPAVILWREADRVNGRFHTLATFTQTKPSAHAEGFGLFFGGQALNGEGEKYTYFLVRQDGKFLIKARTGKETKNITDGWVDHAAVAKSGADGKATNKLEIDGKGKADKVRFFVNGQVVHEMDGKDVDINGIVGLRVNHNLDVHVAGFDIHRL